MGGVGGTGLGGSVGLCDGTRGISVLTFNIFFFVSGGSGGGGFGGEVPVRTLTGWWEVKGDIKKSKRASKKGKQ